MKTLQEWVILANNVFNNKYEYLSKYKKDDLNSRRLLLSRDGVL